MQIYPQAYAQVVILADQEAVGEHEGLWVKMNKGESL
jgi:hypothetical protein